MLNVSSTGMFMILALIVSLKLCQHIRELQTFKKLSGVLAHPVEVKLPLSANRKRYAASIGTTTDGLKWPRMAVSASRAISAVAELTTARIVQQVL